MMGALMARLAVVNGPYVTLNLFFSYIHFTACHSNSLPLRTKVTVSDSHIMQPYDLHYAGHIIFTDRPILFDFVCS